MIDDVYFFVQADLDELVLRQFAIVLVQPFVLIFVLLLALTRLICMTFLSFFFGNLVEDLEAFLAMEVEYHTFVVV